MKRRVVSMYVNSITYSYARENMAKVIAKVCDDGEATIITTPKRKVVMISLDDYNAMVETDYLLSNPANTEHIMTSLKQANENNFSDVKIEDV
jgi:antitoxin YefM